MNNYDICDPGIRCGADKVVATVFLVENSRGRYRVLAYTQRDAERLAQEHVGRERSEEVAPSLFDGF